MNFTGVPSGEMGIGKPGMLSIHRRIVRLFTQNKRATSSQLINSGKSFILCHLFEKGAAAGNMEENNAAERKNRPIG